MLTWDSRTFPARVPAPGATLRSDVFPFQPRNVHAGSARLSRVTPWINNPGLKCFPRAGRHMLHKEGISGAVYHTSQPMAWCLQGAGWPLWHLAISWRCPRRSRGLPARRDRGCDPQDPVSAKESLLNYSALPSRANGWILTPLQLIFGGVCVCVCLCWE